MRIVRRRISVFQPETGDFAADPSDAVFALVYPLWLVVQAEEHRRSADDEAGRIPVDSLLSPVRLVGGDCQHSAEVSRGFLKVAHSHATEHELHALEVVQWCCEKCVDKLDDKRRDKRLNMEIFLVMLGSGLGAD